MTQKLMTALEAYDLVTSGGGNDFALVVSACAEAGPYCLIGGLAVNCYVEPVYTLDADLVMVSEHLPRLTSLLREKSFSVEAHAHAGASQLRVQFTTDPRYQSFPERAGERVVLDTPVQVASLQDVVQGKLWAYGDPQRRLSKRKKDELDLIRLAEAYPELKDGYPPELASLLDA